MSEVWSLLLACPYTSLPKRLDEDMRVLGSLRRARTAVTEVPRRRLARVAAALAAAVVVGSLAVPTPGSAATVGCGSPCDGKDSQTYSALVGGVRGSCAADARTVKTASNVELRYSPFCRTAWARQTGSFGYLTGVLVKSWYSDGRERAWYDELGTSGSWSKMVNDKGLTASACYYEYENEGAYAADIKTLLWCTGRY